MKVLMLTHERGLRGGERQLQRLAEGLVRRGHEVALAGPEGIALAAQFPGPFFALPMANALDVRGVFGLRKRVRAWRPGLVHAFTSRAHSLAHLARIRPLVVTRAVSFPSGGLKYRGGVARFIAVSEATRRALITGGAKPERVRVVPVGVDPVQPDREAGAKLRASHAPESTFVVASVGALEPTKNFGALIAAASPIPGAAVLIAGEGPLRAELQGRGGAVLLGQLPSVAPLLAAADAFALVSHAEGMPLALLEAMHAGLPIVASRAGGMPELVEDGVQGLLVDSRREGEIRAALERLRSDPALARKLGGAARERARSFDVESMVERTLAVYGEALGSSGGAKA